MPKGKQLLGMQKIKKIYGTAKVGEKGQIVIPKDARQFFNINTGDSLFIIGDEKTGLVLTKVDVINQAVENILNEVNK